MKTELHVHTRRYSACAVNTPREMMARLVELGYEAAFLTEHDAVWTEQELAELRGHFPSLKIYPGLELTLYNDEGFSHLLILGTKDPAFLKTTDVGAVLARARRQQCLTVLAHPYRWAGSSEMIARGYYPDAMELHTPNHNALQAVMAKVTAERLSLPLVNTGDAHGVNFLGRFWLETDQPFESASQMRRIILDGNYENCTDV